MCHSLFKPSLFDEYLGRFKLLTFIDKANFYNYLFTGDVIDEKGNLYRLIECED